MLRVTDVYAMEIGMGKIAGKRRSSVLQKKVLS